MRHGPTGKILVLNVGISVGNAGVGVGGLGGAPVALPTFATSAFIEFFRLGRALRVTPNTGMEESGSSFRCLWVSGSGGGL